MLWELKLAKLGFVVEARSISKQPLPDWYLQRPLLLEGEQFYIEAFWELSTERAVGWSLGPIPWRAIQSYGYDAGLDEDVLRAFHRVIRELDEVYLKWQREQQGRRTEVTGGGRIPGGRRRGPATRADGGEEG